MLDKNDIQIIKEVMQEVVTPLETRMGRMEAGQQRLETRMDKLEAGQQRLETRVDKLETEQQKTNIMLETEIKPALQILVEGQQTLLETLAPKNRVEELEQEVAFLKSVVNQVLEQLQQLKKAQ